MEVLQFGDDVPMDGKAVVEENKKKGPSVSLDDFSLLKVIGKGSFGKVMLVRKKDSGVLYAMKVLAKENIVKRNQVSGSCIGWLSPVSALDDSCWDRCSTH